MIVRKEEYKVSEAAYLLDLPSRTVLALCDARIIKASRQVSNGDKAQRKRRFISHAEVVAFNISRPTAERSDLASRLVSPDTEQPLLPIIAQADAEQPADDPAVWLSPMEWRSVVAVIMAMSASSNTVLLKEVARKIGNAGRAVVEHGLKVRNYELAGV